MFMCLLSISGSVVGGQLSSSQNIMNRGKKGKGKVFWDNLSLLLIKYVKETMHFPSLNSIAGVIISDFNFKFCFHVLFTGGC